MQIILSVEIFLNQKFPTLYALLSLSYKNSYYIIFF